MNKFKFRLQKVLEIKQHQEKKHKKELATAQEHLKNEKETLTHLQLHQANHRQQILEKNQQGVNVVELVADYAYFEKLTEVVGVQKAKIGLLEEEVETKRTLVLQKMKEKKMLENLKERKFRQFIQDRNKGEQAFLDEVANRSWLVQHEE